MALTLLLGGARSGKTSFALELAARHEEVTYLATAPVIAGDEELARRVARHRAERPVEWRTVEEEIDLAGTISRIRGDAIVIDCLTMWVNNLMHRGWEDAAIVELARTTVEGLPGGTTVIAVSNEVGLGVHPATELGRSYRDVLGFVNQTWSRAADRALLMVAGRALRLDLPTDS